MTGVVGFVGNQNLIKRTQASFTEVSGCEANYWQQLDCQLMLKVPEIKVGHNSFDNSQFSLELYGDILSVSNEIIDFTHFTNLLIEAYLENKLNDFIAKLNGYFVLVIYDKTKNTITMINDRYGLKPLYFWVAKNHIFGFSSELKGILLHPKFKGVVDKSSLNTFIDLGHFVAQQTLYENIQRMKPASIVKINCLTNNYTQSYYWTWADIQENKIISFDCAVDKLFQYFEQAMERCLATVKQDAMAITLSGGLDSRALLAAAKKQYSGLIKTFTFGKLGCADAVIAEQVSKQAKLHNQFIEINSDNWFEGRELGIWQTDGLINVLHMHALSSVDTISSSSNYLLNGYLGDVTLGGSYLFEGNDNKLILADKVKARYKKHASHTKFESKYYKSLSDDPVFIYNRGIRFISAGTDLLSHKLHNFKPFLDNDLVDFVYSLPDDYRRDGKLYHHMLLKYYPDYFADIPWQKTGEPLSLFNEKITIKAKLKSSLSALLKVTSCDAVVRKLYKKLFNKYEYVDYDIWLRTPEFHRYVIEVVLNEESKICELLTRNKVKSLIDGFYKANTEIKPEVIGSLLTLELYFNQLSRLKNKAEL